MSIMVTQSRQKVKVFSTTATTVKSMTTIRRDTVRPQIQPCPVCSPGLPILEVKAPNGLVYLVDCPVCNGTGYIDRQEWHPAAWVKQLYQIGAWTWNAVRAVIL